VEGRETYNEVLVSIARQLDATSARSVLRDNTSRLFGLASVDDAQARRPPGSG